MREKVCAELKNLMKMKLIDFGKMILGRFYQIVKKKHKRKTRNMRINLVKDIISRRIQ